MLFSTTLCTCMLIVAEEDKHHSIMDNGGRFLVFLLYLTRPPLALPFPLHMFRCFWPRHSINWYLHSPLHLKQISKTYQPTLPKLFCAASNIPMDSNTSGFLLNSSSLESVYYQAKEDDAFIDLGLSLRTLPPAAYHPSGHLVSLEGYDDHIDWPQANQNMKSSDSLHQRIIPEDYDEESEGVQSKERWAYVKVNMDGVIVGRKICILDHGGYSSLALQLEDMFGRQSVSGLRLFQAGSEFSLFYKDREENWRAVGDVPWKEFVECVKRLRIARKNAALLPGS